MPENDQALSTPSEIFTEELKNWIPVFDLMYKLMLENNGIGLAANQVGITKQFFLMLRNKERVVVINPKIIDASPDLELMDEGCLSFKKLYLKVKRSPCIDVEYTNEQGILIKERLTGIDAQVFAHEKEHCDGIVFTEKVSRFALERAKNSRTKLLKKKGA